MTALRMIVLATILLVGNIVEVSGQAPPTPPPGMTQAQFDAMVEAIAIPKFRTICSAEPAEEN